MLRRSFAVGFGALWLPAVARAEPKLAANPFGLGVASGRPRPQSVVLWTRLMAEGGDGERLAAPVAVDWAVAEDDAMQRVVARGQALAWPRAATVSVSRRRSRSTGRSPKT